MNFGYFLMLIIACLSLLSISKKQIIKEELNEALSVSIRNSMEYWVEEGISENQIIYNFLDNFKTNVNSSSDYNIYIYEIDTENGLMDVEVEAVFKYPNMRTGTVSVRKTMIYDEN